MNDAVDSASVVASASAAASAREDPPRVDRTDAAPVLAVDRFEGPLDWWLEMARAQKIDLAKLSIATLIGSFVAAMDTALATRTGDLLPRWAVCRSMRRLRAPLWTASDALAQSARLSATLPDGSPLAAFLPPIPRDAPSRALRYRAAVASTLIAGLERAGDGALLLEQETDWMPIRASRRADDDPVVDASVRPV